MFEILTAILGAAAGLLIEALVKPPIIAYVQRRSREVLPMMFKELEEIVAEAIRDGVGAEALMNLIREKAKVLLGDRAQGKVEQLVKLYLEKYNPAIASENIKN